MHKIKADICTRVHKALRDANLIGIVHGETLVYEDAKEGVRVIIDFPSLGAGSDKRHR
jgi:hypothetical protein